MLRLSVAIILIIFSFIVFSFIAVSYLKSESGAKNFTFVGSKVCQKCHGLNEIGNQYKIWASSPHANAYKNLLTADAMEIAKKNEIASPEKDHQCLKCHATGKGALPEIIEEGVGCESCHGPGSEYHHISNHVNYNDRANGYATAVKNGMYPILWAGSLKMREKLCLSCHKKERPCYQEDPIDHYKFHIPIQVVDSLRKGEVNFKHQLRR